MENISYKALVISEVDGKYIQQIKLLHINDLPQGDVLIRVRYSSINYKDALSASGNKGVTKKYPHTPGIDAAGIISFSATDKFKIGDEVIVSGYDLGMNTSGGLGQFIRVPESWVIKLPEGLTLKEAMILGTAGFTAGISVFRLINFVKPTDGKIVVSGATGGVGSVAISILSKLGFQTVAVSGKDSEHFFLKNLGANEIIARNEFEIKEEKPILTSQFAGGIDTVGGPILERIIKSLQPLGAVTTCGSVSSTQLNLSAFPFILRGISLIGISAQNYPMYDRITLWNKLASDWKPINIMNIYTEIKLEEVTIIIENILAGKIKGRTIVNMD